MKVVYTVSTGYSGSTLLAMLMNAHPAVASVGELSNTVGPLMRAFGATEYPCSCGTEIRECGFWRDVRERCSDAGLALDLHDFDTQLDLGWGTALNRIALGVPASGHRLVSLRDTVLRRSSVYRQRVDTTLNRILGIAREVLAVSQASVFFDASKNLRIAARLADRDDLDFKVVQLVRDPRAVFASTKKRNPEAHLDANSRYWCRTQRGIDWVRSRVGSERCHTIRYEDLCKEPEAALGSLLTFLELDRCDLVDRAHATPHHLIGNDMRKQTFRGIRVDESWREHLSASETARITRIAAPIGRELGYDL